MHPTRTEPGPPAPPAPPAPARIHGLDALRAGALLLGIVLHSLMPFLPGGGWLVADVRTSVAVSPVIGVIHLFRMVLFMMLAGFFGRMVLHRRGTRAYLRDRGLRILLPLVVLGPIALASLVAVGVLQDVVRRTPAPPSQAPGGSIVGLLLVAPGHLWFLAVLVQCIAVTVVARAVLVRVVGADRLAVWAGRVGRVLATPVAGVLVAALPYLGAQLIQGTSGGVEQPVTVLPQAAPLAGFLGAFLVGWCLQAHGDALARLARAWPGNLAAAAVLMLATTVLNGDALPLPAGAALAAAAAWTTTFGLLGAGVRLLRRENAAIAYLADASYWMYIVHLPLLLATEVFLADRPWPIVAKIALAWAVCGVLTLASYDLGVRSTWVGRWLNGRRRPSLLLSRAARGSVAS